MESDLPEDIRDDALRVFRGAIADKATIQDAINKVSLLLSVVLVWLLLLPTLQVNKEALCEVETRFKGQRFKASKTCAAYKSDWGKRYEILILCKRLEYNQQNVQKVSQSNRSQACVYCYKCICYLFASSVSKVFVFFWTGITNMSSFFCFSASSLFKTQSDGLSCLLRYNHFEFCRDSSNLTMIPMSFRSM